MAAQSAAHEGIGELRDERERIGSARGPTETAPLVESWRAAEEWVRERAGREPWLALGVALGAGFLVGRLLSRRR